MKKRFLLLPIIGGFLLASCRINLFGKTIYLFETPEQKEQDKPIDDVTPEDVKQHATKLELDPSKPFYLKVGETKEITVKHSPTPTDSSELETLFTYNGDCIEYQINQEKSAESKTTVYVNVTGKKAGSATLKATSKYNPSLFNSFTINVLDFNEDNDYLWQFEKDRDEQLFIGRKEGIANLSGIEWDFSRSKGIDNTAGYYNALTFGADKTPETKIVFSTPNNRVVKSIAIEAASANSYAQFTAKVGNTVYMDNVTIAKANSDRTMNPYSSKIDIETCAGDITFEVNTIEYNEADYYGQQYPKTPGAFCIKSIMISFEDAPEFVQTKSIDFADKYNDSEDPDFSKLTTTAKSLEIVDGDFSVNFERIKKHGSNDSIQGFALTNGFIDIKLNKSDEVISKVEFKLNYGEASSKNVYSTCVSRLGGEPFSAPGNANDGAGSLKSYVFSDHVNAIRLKPKNTYNVGLEYLKIYTRSGTTGTIKELLVPENFVPKKTSYIMNELFDITGLPDLFFSFYEDIRNERIYPSAFEWYDGPSVDANNPTKNLQDGTTYVYGVYRNYKVKVSGIIVEDLRISLTLVKSTANINGTNKYYLIDKNSKALLKSSTNGNMNTKSGCVVLDETLGDSASIPLTLNNDFFNFVKQSDGRYQLKASNGKNYLGMNTSSGAKLSGATTVTFKNWNVEFDSETGSASFKINDDNGENVRYLCYDGSKFNLSEEPAEILVYQEDTVN